ncbi:hypothetical protein [Parasulfitobacter algicola]|uniref:Uncharacterized protein n=1 Tax=Parasulfitobacter algicola TaxID=2614809 RepID=A0ABX2IX34_9RHOB|nr:hypothetical protein [Sulfitobacter algicola]NSX55750.1 hypothetical protein [Sulfitobacter algicola]
MTRKVLVWIAFVLTLLLVGVEIGARFLPMPQVSAPTQFIQDLPEEDRAEARRQHIAKAGADKPPGLAAPSLALIDGIFLWTTFMMALSTLGFRGWHNKFRAIATPILMLILLIVSIIMLIFAIIKLILMLSLLMAVPFGTIVYLAIFGSFNTGGVTIMLGIATFLRAAAFVLLLISSWRYLKNKTLVFNVIAAFLCGIILGFIFALLPGLLHSIGDAIGAIIILIIALIWALILFIRSIPGILSIVRV